jgi:hypothetical protein
MADPWEGCTQAWGPGSLEDYVKLSGQAGGECPDPIEVFNIFIKRNVDTKHHAHLADSDDNDAEFVRRAIRDAIVKMGTLCYLSRADMITAASLTAEEAHLLDEAGFVEDLDANEQGCAAGELKELIRARAERDLTPPDEPDTVSDMEPT